MNLERVHTILRAASEKRILVIGDLMLDEFVWGRVSRISPEAPVPVVEVLRESYYPGGAANVARNLREFSSSVLVMGVVGNDSHAERLKSILVESRIDLDALQIDPTYQTIVKTRIIARQQQVVRVDRERPQTLSVEFRERAIQSVAALVPLVDAIIFEDYGKGFLTQAFVDSVAGLARSHGKLLMADPNPRNPLAWRGMTVVKPNRSEAFAAANRAWQEPEKDPSKDKSLIEVGNILLEQWAPDQLLITLGEQGMILFDRNAPPYHVPSRAREVYDLSGAGDTAIALFTLASASGATPIEAAEISNHASSVVVAKLGTATLTPAELVRSFDLNG
jgi:D-beta-D-heptose 7-phosphate kinase/D-beta-D-heptose 1-phosphate adenosyltransferase